VPGQRNGRKAAVLPLGVDRYCAAVGASPDAVIALGHPHQPERDGEERHQREVERCPANARHRAAAEQEADDARWNDRIQEEGGQDRRRVVQRLADPGVVIERLVDPEVVADRGRERAAHDRGSLARSACASVSRAVARADWSVAKQPATEHPRATPQPPDERDANAQHHEYA